MDAVITYVNMSDPIWIEQYKQSIGNKLNENRFRDLGTINLQIKCIRKFMPWIENIYVVVSTNSQATHIEGATIITHDQIIPQEQLPTFNSCVIELFLHKIPNLSRYFIYFNDDIFPINYVSQSDFFDTALNKPILSFKTINEPPSNIYRHQCKNSSNLARLLSGLAPSSIFIKPDHICIIHDKNAYETIWSKSSRTLLSSITKLRTIKNYNQYLFADYLFYSNQCKIKRLNYMYLPYKTHSAKEIYEIITKHKCNLICVCDNVDDDNYSVLINKGLNEILNK